MLNVVMKKLYKSKDDKVVFGILSGIGEYFEIDPILIRIGFVLIIAISGHFIPFVIIYFILYFIVPKHPNVPQVEVMQMPAKKEDVETKDEDRENV